MTILIGVRPQVEMTEPHNFRIQCRSQKFQVHTSNVCPGYVQANLIVLPELIANDFYDLCMRNPVPCPLLAVTATGDPTILKENKVIFDKDINLAKDIPKYNIYENGELVEETKDISSEWSSSHVGFLIGCSYSFERALIDAGLPPRNVTQGTCVSMYRTKRYLDPAGIFTDSTYVVSMRPYKLEDLKKVREITGKYREFHGEPIAWGFEDAYNKLGIKDISNPDFGEPTLIKEDEIPVFWGCGVTPQSAVESLGSKVKEKCMGHTPGHMLILDLKDEQASSM